MEDSRGLEDREMEAVETFYVNLSLVFEKLFRVLLVYNNQRLVYWTLNHYFRIPEDCIDREDFESDGMHCLVDCAVGYNPGRGVKFATYLTKSLLRRWKRTKFTLGKRGLTNFGEVSNAREVLPKIESLSPAATGEDQQGQVVHHIADKRTVETIEEERQNNVANLTHRYLAAIDPKVAGMIRAKYFEDKSPREIGEEVGLSAERVRQIINKGLLDLRVIAECVE